MSTEFNKIAVLGRREDPRVGEPLQALTEHLLAAGVTVVGEPDFDGVADLVIAIGGDGTMLYAAGTVAGSNVPLLGINRGRLGFLADVTPDEMLSSVDNVLSGNYTRDSRLLLKAILQRPDGSRTEARAFNDVVLQRRETGRMVDFETLVGGRYVNTHSGDGLVVATPTGSTAYALSCGGPIIQPQLDAVVIVPVCPHTLTDRPIVVPSSSPIEVALLEREDTKAEITVDGNSLGEFTADDKLTISAADSRMTLLHPPGYDYYEILRSKLYWGRDSRNRGVRTRKS
jgi:NAD+ kinase